MVQTVGSVPCERFDDLVDRSVELVRVMTGCQFALGDIALEIAPLRTHGGGTWRWARARSWGWRTRYACSLSR